MATCSTFMLAILLIGFFGLCVADIILGLMWRYESCEPANLWLYCLVSGCLPLGGYAVSFLRWLCYRVGSTGCGCLLSLLSVFIALGTLGWLIYGTILIASDIACYDPLYKLSLSTVIINWTVSIPIAYFMWRHMSHEASKDRRRSTK